MLVIKSLEIMHLSHEGRDVSNWSGCLLLHSVRLLTRLKPARRTGFQVQRLLNGPRHDPTRGTAILCQSVGVGHEG